MLHATCYMRLIVGLGNPGKQYEKTRHNAGFIVLDEIQKELSLPQFQENKKFEAQISEANLEGKKIIFAKPQTFMNKSGQSIQAIMSFYKIPVENLIILHDDLDINLGEFKISDNSSAAGHNGVTSVFETLGTQKIKRIRIGIEGAEKKLERKMNGADFVLQDFSQEETQKIQELAQKIIPSL